MSLTIGPYEIFSVESGRVRLDGGAMFGVVPKTLWEKKIQADDRNRILLSMRNLVLRDRKTNRLILVDTGAGLKWTAKEIDMYGFDFFGDPVVDFLKTLGHQPSEVTDVIVTHLHFDHNGGMTEWKNSPESGETRMRFPNAIHWTHRNHYEHALKPNPKDRASFLKRDWEAVVKAEKFKFLEGLEPKEAPPHIKWFISQGHTPWQLHPIVFDSQTSLMYCADLVPTSHHLPVAWVMGYDNQPLVVMEEKAKVLKMCEKENLILAYEHDVSVAASRVTFDEKGRPIQGKTYMLSPTGTD